MSRAILPFILLLLIAPLGHADSPKPASQSVRIANMQFTPAAGRAVQNEGHYFYGHYYAVQAMFLAGGDYWGDWYPAIRDELCDRQQEGGNWDGDFSQDYATSMALIILQMPNRYLTVYAGKGPGS